MTEEKKETSEVAPAGAARIAELEREIEKLRRENRALLGKKKMLTTSMVTAEPTVATRPNRMISTTQPKPHGFGGGLLQTHGLKLPEPDAAEILARVKGDRISVVTKKEKA